MYRFILMGRYSDLGLKLDNGIHLQFASGIYDTESETLAAKIQESAYFKKGLIRLAEGKVPPSSRTPTTTSVLTSRSGQVQPEPVKRPQPKPKTKEEVVPNEEV